MLVVEDEAAVRRLLEKQLSQLGYRVLACEDGASALALAARTERLDLLLTDVIMPGMNGRELANRLRRERPGVGVVFISGYTGDVLDAQGSLDPGEELIAKPFEVGELAQRVRRALDRRAGHAARNAAR